MSASRRPATAGGLLARKGEARPATLPRDDHAPVAGAASGPPPAAVTLRLDAAHRREPIAGPADGPAQPNTAPSARAHR